MPSFATLITVASVALSVSAAPAALKRDAPATWATGYLENYDVYHTRYIALNCQTQHNTTFFDSCCHPLLATESLSSRPADCTPDATAISSASAVATASATSSASTDAADEYCSDSADIAQYVSSAAAVATSASEVVYTSGTATATLAVENQIAATSTAAAATSTSEAADPTTSSTSEAAAATSTSSSSSSGSYSGYATYFLQGGNAGACGTVHSDSDHVIAINSNGFWQDYASNNNSPYCGKSVTITNTNNGKTTTATVADVCPTCEGSYSIDLSVGAFTAIATEAEGMVPITWSFN